MVSLPDRSGFRVETRRTQIADRTKCAGMANTEYVQLLTFVYIRLHSPAFAYIHLHSLTFAYKSLNRSEIDARVHDSEALPVIAAGSEHTQTAQSNAEKADVNKPQRARLAARQTMCFKSVSRNFQEWRQTLDKLVAIAPVAGGAERVEVEQVNGAVGYVPVGRVGPVHSVR